MESPTDRTENTSVATDAEHPRAPYQKPRLEVYGSLSALTLGTTGSGGDANMLMLMSDARTKQDVVRIGTHPLGFGIYLFNYRPEFRARWGHGRHVGFLAHEVEEVVPEAVATTDDGYLAVDYGLIARRA
jgi:hypothetical protein